MHAWRSLSRCLLQPGCIAAPVCRSSPSLHPRCHSIRHKSSSTKQELTDEPRKHRSLSEALRLLDSAYHSQTSTKEPPSPKYLPRLKARPPSLAKTTKSKRRVVPREREQRKRLKDRRDAKQLLKEITSLNKQLSFESGDNMNSEDVPRQSPDWKGISQKLAL
jgi:hypothetical protein